MVTYLAYFTAFGERLDAGFRTAYTFAGDWGYRDDGDMGLPYIGARWYDVIGWRASSMVTSTAGCREVWGRCALVRVSVLRR